MVNLAIVGVVERKVDGSFLGLSQELSVDSLSPTNVVFELKTGAPKPFHKLAIAGYALALEACEGVPVDYGLLVYLSFSNSRRVPHISTTPVFVGDELRREFLEQRDSALEMLYSGRDPGLASSCPSTCPYREVCGVE